MTIVFLLLMLQAASPDELLRVGVAASLKDAIAQIAPLFEQATANRIETVVGSSGQLASQVRYGAPIDVIISAADEPLAALEHDRLIAAGSTRQFASNRLVLVVPAESKLELGGFRDLPRAGVRRIVIGDPATVPAGQYAAQVFQSLELSDALRERIVHAANVRQVLAYVERDEVDAGVVYATDARIADGRVRVVEVADVAWHRPIRYSAAIVERTRRSDAARSLLDFLSTNAARGVLEKHGFLVPPQPTTAAAAPVAASTSQPTSRPTPTSAPAAETAPAVGAERRP